MSAVYMHAQPLAVPSESGALMYKHVRKLVEVQTMHVVYAKSTCRHALQPGSLWALLVS